MIDESEAALTRADPRISSCLEGVGAVGTWLGSQSEEMDRRHGAVLVFLVC